MHCAIPHCGHRPCATVKLSAPSPDCRNGAWDFHPPDRVPDTKPFLLGSYPPPEAEISQGGGNKTWRPGCRHSARIWRLREPGEWKPQVVHLPTKASAAAPASSCTRAHNGGRGLREVGGWPTTEAVPRGVRAGKAEPPPPWPHSS